MTLPFWMAVHAKVYAMDGQLGKAMDMLCDAKETAQRTGEVWYLAELLRLQGELFLRQAGSPDAVASEAQSSFEGAVNIAHRQQARLLEMRATTSLARLLQRQGCLDTARSRLSASYGWFTEGFKLRDLSDASALLSALGSAPAADQQRQ